MNIWRRHVSPCKSVDRRDTRCGCPIHYDHRFNGKRIRKTLKTTNWQKALADIRLRHTFATEMLQAGNSLETVAQLLGHSSTKVTEKSYSHWIRGRQEKLEDAVKNSWARLGTLDLSQTEKPSKSQ